MQMTKIRFLGAVVVLLAACSKRERALPISGIHPCEPAACERACETDAAACVRAAELYFSGTNGHALDLTRSFALASKACDRGHHHGCTLVGLHHQDGRGVSWNPAEAQRAYERACKLGGGTGCYNLATMYSGGHGVIADEAKAATYMEKATQAWQAACDGRERRWCTNAAYALARQDAEGTRERRLELDQRACDAGVDIGCTQAAIVKADLGLASDEQVLAELQRLCNAGEGTACSIAAARLFLGKLAPHDPKRGLELWTRACELGDAEGCEAIGTEAFLGEHTPRDRTAAIRSFERACDRGLARACAKLSVLHRDEGQRVAQLTFARRACQMNDAPACMIVGAMYELGTDGVTKDHDEALRWFTEACRGGDLDGCGLLARRGIELPVGDDLRGDIYRRLCAKGLPSACDRVN